MTFTHLLLFAILVFSSCSKDAVTTILDAQELKLIHENVKIELQKSFSLDKRINNSNSLTEEEDIAILLASDEYKANVALVEDNGLEHLLAANGFSSQLKGAAEFFGNNSTNESVYETISSNYQLSKTDANDLFAIIEAVKIVEEAIQSKGVNAKWGWAETSCAVSVAATILVTVSAVTIGSAAAPGAGTALGFWVAGKILATVGVVASCAGLKSE